MDSAREPLPAFVDPSLIEAPFEVAVLGSPRTRQAHVSRDVDDIDVIDALLDETVTTDLRGGQLSSHAKRAARAAAKIAAKEQAEAERAAISEAKTAAKRAKREAKLAQPDSRIETSGREAGTDIDVEPAPHVELSPEEASDPHVGSEPTVDVRSQEPPTAKKSGLSFDELIGGTSS